MARAFSQSSIAFDQSLDTFQNTEDYMTEQLAETKARKGWETTEFWLALIVAVGAIGLTASGAIDSDTLLKALGLTSAGYGVSRGLSKK